MKRMLLGVGNELSADDGAGPAVAKKLRTARGWRAVDCGLALENATGIVIRERPDLLVVVDAARMGLPPGSTRRLPIEARDRMLASTHGLPLPFILDRLGEAAREIVLIGIEPEDVRFGEEMSAVVADAVERLAELLRSGEVDRVPRVGAKVD